MSKYLLKTKDGEVINSTNVSSELNALLFFSKIKRIPSKDLLKIYKIEKDEDRNNN